MGSTDHGIGAAPFPDWLDGLAAPRPDPGGGAAAAVMLGLGAALVEMVAGYPPAGTVDVVAVTAAARRLRTRATDLVDVDAAASLGLVTAWRRARDTQATDGDRDDLRIAALAAARSSLDIVAVAHDAAPLLRLLATDGSRLVVADVAVSAIAFAAAVRAATVNLVGNLETAAAAGADPADLAPYDGTVEAAAELAAALDDVAALSPE